MVTVLQQRREERREEDGARVMDPLPHIIGVQIGAGGRGVGGL